jgi:ribosomal protein S18 acetylase RimI-like enzyme
MEFRSAGVDDAAAVAALHADSWRRHYRGAYSDSFLDGDVVTNRLGVWAERLAAPADTATVLAEEDGELKGFVHVMFDHDPEWGSLVDNLHVHYTQQRTGIGTQLMAHAARAVIDQAAGDAIYLWVLEQNTRAQAFYLATGATQAGQRPISPPGGDPSRLNGSPLAFRMVWPDASRLK